MSPSKILFFLCLSFVAGIFLESITKIPQIFILGFLLLAILLVCFALYIKCPAGHFICKRDLLILLGFYLLVFALGILRVQSSEFNIENDKLSELNGKGQIVLTGVISNEPDVRDTSQKIKVKVSDSIVLVTTNRYPEYQYLDEGLSPQNPNVFH